MKFPFAYSLVAYHSYNKETFENKYTLHHGVGICEGFSDAMYQIEKYYGNDLIRITDLILLEESNMIELTNAEKDVIVDRDHLKCVYCNEKGRLTPINEDNILSVEVIK